MPSASWIVSHWAWNTSPRWTIPLLMEHLANVQRNIIDPSPLTRAVQCVSTAFARWMLAKTQLNSTMSMVKHRYMRTIPRSIYRYYRIAQLIIASPKLYTHSIHLQLAWMQMTAKMIIIRCTKRIGKLSQLQLFNVAVLH